jgi:hypothetical protein
MPKDPGTDRVDQQGDEIRLLSHLSNEVQLLLVQFHVTIVSALRVAHKTGVQVDFEHSFVCHFSYRARKHTEREREDEKKRLSEKHTSPKSALTGHTHTHTHTHTQSSKMLHTSAHTHTHTHTHCTQKLPTHSHTSIQNHGRPFRRSGSTLSTLTTPETVTSSPGTATSTRSEVSSHSTARGTRPASFCSPISCSCTLRRRDTFESEEAEKRSKQSASFRKR